MVSKTDGRADCKMSDPTNLDSSAEEPTFEAGLVELQDLVRVLEEGSLGLDESIARFERGITLLRRCYQALGRAEQKIELLTGFDRSGNPVVAAFDATATLDASNAAPAKRQAKTARKKPEPESQPGLSLPEEKDRSLPLF
jgi:exodeoxyribonuclease VII small subunit